MWICSNNLSNLLKLWLLTNSIKCWHVWGWGWVRCWGCCSSCLGATWLCCRCWCLLNRKSGCERECNQPTSRVRCSGIPFIRYSTALSGLPKAARRAATTWSRGNPITVILLIWNQFYNQKFWSIPTNSSENGFAGGAAGVAEVAVGVVAAGVAGAGVAAGVLSAAGVAAGVVAGAGVVSVVAVLNYLYEFSDFCG